MSLLRQSTQALRAATYASTSARWISTSAVLRNTAHPNTSPAPTTRTDNQGRDLAAEQLQRHERAVTADLVSSAPGMCMLHTMRGLKGVQMTLTFGCPDDAPVPR